MKLMDSGDEISQIVVPTEDEVEVSALAGIGVIAGQV